ncbi:hypothetical protein [Saccharopolyspora gregorii]|uniref:hypothetical protein n=1 Tax=Saccharopolyspora gregorii TaxID=33914 RepID=UPI0031ECBD78
MPSDEYSRAWTPPTRPLLRNRLLFTVVSSVTFRPVLSALLDAPSSAPSLVPLPSLAPLPSFAALPDSSPDRPPLPSGVASPSSRAEPSPKDSPPERTGSPSRMLLVSIDSRTTDT